MAAAISMPVQVTAGGVQATVGTLAISPTADGHIAENDRSPVHICSTR